MKYQCTEPQCSLPKVTPIEFCIPGDLATYTTILGAATLVVMVLFVIYFTKRR